MRVPTQVLVCLLVLAAVPAVPAAAQGDASGPLTMISHFKAPPGDAFPDWVRTMYGATLEGLVEDGKVLAWGITMPLFHHDMETTHSIYMSVPDWASLAAAFDAFEEREGTLSAEERAAMGELFSKMDMSTHRDELVQHVRFALGGEGTPAEKYFDIGYHTAHPGKGPQAMTLYDRLIKPVYERLLADGVITGYGAFVPVEHSGGGWTHGGWVGLADLAKMDAVHAAFDEAEASWTPEDGQMVMETFDASAHYDLLLQVLD